MNKTIVIVALVVIGFVGLIWWGSSHQEPITSNSKINRNAKSVLSTPEKFYDFGTISMKNGRVSKEFVVANNSNKDVFIPSLITSCMCTNAYIVESDGTTKGPFGMEGMGYVLPADETIKAGESRIIKVVFDPNAHGPAGVGLIERFVILTEESGAGFELEIRALVTP